jgi:hypothetical protein
MIAQFEKSKELTPNRSAKKVLGMDINNPTILKKINGTHI